MFPSYLPVKAPDPGAYHFNFLGHNQKCLTPDILFHFSCTPVPFSSFFFFRSFLKKSDIIWLHSS